MRVVSYVLFWACLVALAADARAQSHLETMQQMPTRSAALEQAAHAPPLALKDAIAVAFERNADLTAARADVERLTHRPAQERSLPPPMLEAQVWQWPINSLNPANTNMFMVSVFQDLPGRGKRASAEAAAQADVRTAEASTDVRAHDVALAVTNAYVDLAVARQAITLHLASVDLLHQIADVAEVRYAAGRLSQPEVLKATIETTRLHGDVVELELNASQAASQLNVLLNRPADTPIGPLDDLEAATLRLSLEDLVTLVSHAEQPELRQGQQDVAHARLGVTMAEATRKPDWAVGAGYMLQPHQTDAWLAQVRATWPNAPWARKAADARVAEAQAAVRSAEAEVQAREVSVQLAVAQAYARLKAAEQRVALISTTLLPQTRQAVAAAQIGYQADRADAMTLIESERMVLDVELSGLRAVADWHRALADLERAIGSALPPSALALVAREEVRP